MEISKELTTDILLSPEASPEFLAPLQLAKLVESLPEKMKSQVKADGKAGDTDPKQIVRDYAEEHQLSENEVLNNVDALILQYEQSPEPEKRCLAAIYRKHVDKAVAICRAAAISKTDLLKQKRQEVENLSKSLEHSGIMPEGQSVVTASTGIPISSTHPLALPVTNRLTPAQLIADSRTPAKLEETKRQLIKLTEEVVGEFRSAGNAYYANYQFAEALGAYKEGLGYVEKKDLPTLWADTQWRVGLASWEMGIRTKDAAIAEHLIEAVKRYREAQTVYTKAEFPEAWAAITNSLGLVLWDQGTRTNGEASTTLLAQAVEAYQAALTVYTKDTLPQQWAMTQINLGVVFWDQGTRTNGEASTALLAQAVEAYQAALMVYTKDTLPQQWAMTQINLGVVLWNQGTHIRSETGTLLLVQAIEAYQAALTVYTKNALPQQWAETQNRLGLVLKDQGTRTRGEAGTALLAQAVEAYQAALTVYTKDALPRQWAMTQDNLAEVSLAREDWSTAVESYRNVLMIYPDDREDYQTANAVYHDKLFAYAAAFELSKQWLERHQDDVSAQANFAESHLVTEQYGEAERRFADLLKKADLGPGSLVGLRILARIIHDW
ncbi:MAG TPA: hypothetical protein PKD12_06430 [Nitrospira sp.]|nr:hypothetical protein [Nitrospira sp.]